MGARGPVPKRSTERRRRNAEDRPTTAQRTGKVEAPEPPRLLHEVALAWYESLKESGQADYYEPSDWAAARYVALAMTKTLNGRRFSAPLFAAVWGAMNDLLTTEQARRRARVEVERALEEAAKRPGVTAIEQYRKALA
jgi:hypothetical protein